MQYPWNHSRRFNSYAEHCKILYGHRIQKLTIDASFTCPNRDGTVAVGGCTYCNNNAFNPSYNTPVKSITQQLSEGVEFHQVRYRNAKSYLAYFQAFSNTHAPIEHLKKLYTEALSFPGVEGLVIGTRPDCIDDEKLDYLQELSKDYLITVEYGLESIYNKTLERINRGHSFEQSVKAIENTAKRGINVGAHFIVGLPGETEQEIIDSVNIISQLPLNAVKFHQLQIIKDTAMSKEYEVNPDFYHFYPLDEYIELIVSVVERLNPNFVLERIAGEVPPRYLAGPGWGLLRVHNIVNLFEKKLEERNTWQGRLFDQSKNQKP